jgi:hypothetical protein
MARRGAGQEDSADAVRGCPQVPSIMLAPARTYSGQGRAFTWMLKESCQVSGYSDGLGDAVCGPSGSCRRCSEQRASLRRSLGRCAGHGINDLNQYREPETVTLVLGRTFDRSHCRRTASWPLARWNKIKVSVRLSVRTVLARAYLWLVSARVSSCFSCSTRITCGDGT